MDELNYFQADQEQLISELQKKNLIIEKLRSLIEINTIISSSLEKRKVLKTLIDKTMHLLDCEKCNILLVDFESNQLKYEVVSNEDEMEKLKLFNLEMGEGVAGTVWKVGKPFLSADPNKDLRLMENMEIFSGFKMNSIMAIPLVVNGRVIGVMEGINKKLGLVFDYFDMEIFQHLAIQAGIAIENAGLYETGITDGMTQLYLHKYFQLRLQEHIKAAERYDYQLSLVMFDIDLFKPFNDNFGHQVGDQVLIKVAQVIKNQSRTVDVPCRYGGEEFSVILPHTNAKGALTFAERIRKIIEKIDIHYDNQLLRITISGGISSKKEHGIINPVEMIKKADAALYFSKENGRNQNTIYSFRKK